MKPKIQYYVALGMICCLLVYSTFETGFKNWQGNFHSWGGELFIWIVLFAAYRRSRTGIALLRIPFYFLILAAVMLYIPALLYKFGWGDHNPANDELFRQITTVSFKGAAIIAYLGFVAYTLVISPSVRRYLRKPEVEP